MKKKKKKLEFDSEGSNEEEDDQGIKCNPSLCACACWSINRQYESFGNVLMMICDDRHRSIRLQFYDSVNCLSTHLRVQAQLASSASLLSYWIISKTATPTRKRKERNQKSHFGITFHHSLVQLSIGKWSTHQCIAISSCLVVIFPWIFIFIYTKQFLIPYSRMNEKL